MGESQAITLMDAQCRPVKHAHVVRHGGALGFTDCDGGGDFPTPTAGERFLLEGPHLWEVVCAAADDDRPLFFAFAGQSFEIVNGSVLPEENDRISIQVNRLEPATFSLSV